MSVISVTQLLAAALVGLAAFIRCAGAAVAPRLTTRLPYEPGLTFVADVPASFDGGTADGARSPLQVLAQLAEVLGAEVADLGEWSPVVGGSSGLFAADRDRERVLLRWPGGVELALIASSEVERLAADALPAEPPAGWAELAALWHVGPVA